MDPNTIIDELGGTNAVAKLCETSPQAVSKWRKKGVPSARLMYLKAVRPKVFKHIKENYSAVVQEAEG